MINEIRLMRYHYLNNLGLNNDLDKSGLKSLWIWLQAGIEAGGIFMKHEFHSDFDSDHVGF